MSVKQSQPAGSARQRILIVDDHPMTRYGMAQMLRQECDLEVCGEAEGASRALQLVKSLKPDLVLTDLTMPGQHGLEFLKDLRATHPSVAVLVVSMHDEALYAERVLKAGGRGYVMKNAGGKELLKAIRRVLSGHVFLSETMAENLLDVFPDRRSQAADAVVGRLTDREFEVFQCLGQGMTSREIGAELRMGVKTVETHRRHVREKLKLRTGPELIRFAVRWGSSQQGVS